MCIRDSLKAGRPIPPAEFYEDFDQLENGVGMMRLFEDEFRAELDRPHRIYGTKQIDVDVYKRQSPGSADRSGPCRQ